MLTTALQSSLTYQIVNICIIKVIKKPAFDSQNLILSFTVMCTLIELSGDNGQASTYSPQEKVFHSKRKHRSHYIKHLI